MSTASTAIPAGSTRAVALVFPGQGAQHPRMAAWLYDREPVFTRAMDVVFDELGAEGRRLRDDWLTTAPAVPLDHVTRSQMLLFAVDHALGQLVLSWGVRPVALLGHSVGEVVAAVTAGVLDVRSAARLMADRVARLAAGPAGGMLAVAAGVVDVTPHLRDGVVVGAVNAPRQVVLAGPERPLREVADALTAAGFTCRRTPSSSPFHSPVLAEAAAGTEQLVGRLAIAAPATPIYSGYTAARVGWEELRSADYWVRQPCAPVLFWTALGALLADLDVTLVEAGPGQGLTAIARRHPAVRSGRSGALALLAPPAAGPDGDRAAMRAAVAAIGTEDGGTEDGGTEDGGRTDTAATRRERRGEP